MARGSFKGGFFRGKRGRFWGRVNEGDELRKEEEDGSRVKLGETLH